MKHQALLWLPEAARKVGLNVIELDGWEENQTNYFWTDTDNTHQQYSGKPNGWMWHHTASAGYTPYVKNSRGQTKANIWMGLYRGEANNRLYSTGPGVPTMVISSSGPANYSAGSGKRWILDDYVTQDKRFRGPQKNSDDSPYFYGNRYYGATEIVHPGDGSPVDVGVWRMAYVVASLMSEHWDWSAWRHIGHLDHTRRKIDPRFEQGTPYTMGLMQDAIEGYMAGVITLPPPEVGDDYEMKTIRIGDGYKSKGTAALRPTVKAAQIMLAAAGFTDPKSVDGTCAADGVFGPGTEGAVKGFQLSKGLPADGVVGPKTWAALEG